VTAEVPTLMVSYEKALQYPERCVQAIADHCGITVSHDQISEIAASCVRNGDKAYLGIA